MTTDRTSREGEAGYVSPLDAPTLESSLEELANQPGTDQDTAELLQHAVTATRRMPMVTGAGLMLIDSDQALRYVVASDEPGGVLESSQEHAGEGPCIDALVHDAVVATRDLHEDPRWPKLAALLDTSPVRAVLGAPVHLGGGAVGTLNVYADRPYDWSGDDGASIQTIATVVDSLLISAVAHQRSDRLARQLQYALDYRVIIERAVGYLMSRHDLEPVAAFQQLRAAARNSRRKAVDVARDVLEGRPLPGPTRPQRAPRPSPSNWPNRPD